MDNQNTVFDQVGKDAIPFLTENQIYAYEKESEYVSLDRFKKYRVKNYIQQTLFTTFVLFCFILSFFACKEMWYLSFLLLPYLAYRSVWILYFIKQKKIHYYKDFFTLTNVTSEFDVQDKRLSFLETKSKFSWLVICMLFFTTILVILYLYLMVKNNQGVLMIVLFFMLAIFLCVIMPLDFGVIKGEFEYRFLGFQLENEVLEFDAQYNSWRIVPFEKK